VYDLTGFTLTSRMVGRNFDKILSDGSGIVIIDAVTGAYRVDIDLTGTSQGAYKLDVKYTNGLIVDYSDLITINVNGVITQ
jgi:hypothetical protein